MVPRLALLKTDCYLLKSWYPSPTYMKTPKVLALFMVAMFALTVMVSVAGTVAATDISNMTDTITELFVDLIPLIVIMGIFGLIIGMVKIRGLK